MRNCILWILAFVLACSPSGLIANELPNIKSNPLIEEKITEKLSVKIIVEEKTNNLFWEILETKQPNILKVRSEIGVAPGEQFFYQWMEDTKMFWFCTEKYIQIVDLNQGLPEASIVTVTSVGSLAAPGIPKSIKRQMKAILK